MKIRLSTFMVKFMKTNDEIVTATRCVLIEINGQLNINKSKILSFVHGFD